MGKLVNYETWSRREFEPGSEPSVTKTRNAIIKGQLKGCVINGQVWVDDDALNLTESHSETNNKIIDLSKHFN